MEIKPDSPVLPEGVTARFTDHNSLAGLLRDGENLIRGTVEDEGFLERYRKYLNKKVIRQDVTEALEHASAYEHS
jgi:hypothetical protein